MGNDNAKGIGGVGVQDITPSSTDPAKVPQLPGLPQHPPKPNPSQKPKPPPPKPKLNTKQQIVPMMNNNLIQAQLPFNNQMTPYLLYMREYNRVLYQQMLNAQKKNQGFSSNMDQFAAFAQYKVKKQNHVKNIENFFKPKKQLGFGASCKVYLAEHKETKKLYAVKSMIRRDKFNPKLFLRELTILEELRAHNGIVRLFDSYMDATNYYIVLEFCSGGSFYERISKESTFSEKLAAKLVLQILDAVDYMHSKDIVHKDIKPGNMVFDRKGRKGRLLLIDFGTAEIIDNEKFYPFDGVGTYTFVPPEFDRARKGWEIKKGDVWAIGIITYVMICGIMPFVGRDNKAIFARIKKYNGKLAYPANINMSKDCINFILRLLHIKVRNRLTAKQAMEHRWIGGAPKPNSNSNSKMASAKSIGKSIVASIGGKSKTNANMNVNVNDDQHTVSKVNKPVVKPVNVLPKKRSIPPVHGSIMKSASVPPNMGLGMAMPNMNMNMNMNNMNANMNLMQNMMMRQNMQNMQNLNMNNMNNMNNMMQNMQVQQQQQQQQQPYNARIVPPQAAANDKRESYSHSQHLGAGVGVGVGAEIANVNVNEDEAIGPMAMMAQAQQQQRNSQQNVVQPMQPVQPVAANFMNNQQMMSEEMMKQQQILMLQKQQQMTQAYLMRNMNKQRKLQEKKASKKKKMNEGAQPPSPVVPPAPAPDQEDEPPPPAFY